MTVRNHISRVMICCWPRKSTRVTQCGSRPSLKGNQNQIQSHYSRGMELFLVSLAWPC